MSTKPTLLAICDDVRLEIGGKISVIGLYDTIALPAIPGGANLCVTTRWNSAGPARATVALFMLTPDNPAPIPVITQQIELADHEGLGFCSAGTIAKFSWQFHAGGMHHIVVTLDGREAGTIPLMVRKLPQAERPVVR
ncbi:MAG: DUF6941 family protein [Bacteroidota bacterium]